MNFFQKKAIYNASNFLPLSCYYKASGCGFIYLFFFFKKKKSLAPVSVTLT